MKRAPISKIAASKQVNGMQGYTEAECIASINQAIGCDYKGLFFRKANGSTAPSQSPIKRIKRGALEKEVS